MKCYYTADGTFLLASQWFTLYIIHCCHGFLIINNLMPLQVDKQMKLSSIAYWSIKSNQNKTKK